MDYLLEKSLEQYDSFIGKTNVKKADLTEFFDEDLIPEKTNSPEVHWKEMPEFEQESKSTYKTIYVHFRNEEDYKEFQKLIDQHLTSKTKSIWYPELDRTENSLLRWIE